MFGPSGFFQAFEDTSFGDSSIGLDVLYESESGFNILYKVNKNGRFFVYKALKPEYRGNPFYEDLLRKDFNIGFSLTHTAICQYYALIENSEIGSCIVMEWIDGCNLEQLMQNGHISRESARKLICEICDALDYMHKKQVVHRDLKPENIIVTYNGTNVKIIDFGLSDADSYSVYKEPAGTRVYASPELIAGDQVDGRSDIWSLGLIIREITGGAYSRVVSKCLKRDREKRYQSALEVKSAVMTSWRRKVVIASSFLLFSSSLLFGGKLLDSAFSIEDIAPTSEMSYQNVEFKQDAPEIKPEADTVVTSDTQDIQLGTKSDVQADIQPDTPQYHTAESETETVPPANKDFIDAKSLDDMFDAALKEL